MKRFCGKPVGNDKKMNKITFVSKYGLEKAKEELEKTIEKGVKELEDYGKKAEFLRELALYIKDRQK